MFHQHVDPKLLFNQIDVSGDGSISREELFNAINNKNDAVASHHIPTSKSSFDTLFTKIDTDKNNSISEKEFEAFLTQRYKELEDAFAFLVRDSQHHQHSTTSTTHHIIKNKTLTSSAFRRAAAKSGITLSDDDLRVIMKKLDADGDNEVSFQEFVDALMLSPLTEVNPKAFFDSWFTDVFVDDGQSDYTTAREIRLVEHPFHHLKKDKTKKKLTEEEEVAKKEEESSSTPTFGQVVLKKLVCGGASGALSRTMTAPIDRVRILMMTSTHRLSLGEALSAARKGGARSLFRGNGTNCIKITPEMSIKLLSFDLLKNNISRDPGNITIWERLLAGAGAGLAAQATIYPMEVIRTRMAIAPIDKPYKSILDCARQTFMSGGVRAFYAGVVPSCVGILPYAGIDLSLNSYLKDVASDYLKSQNREVSVPLLLSCGMVSSSVATVCTFPLNVIRTKAQATGMSVVEILKEIFTGAEKGMPASVRPSTIAIIKRLYVGLVPSLSKAAPATAISYSAYDFLGKRWSY